MTGLDDAEAFATDWFAHGASQAVVAPGSHYLVGLLGNDACIVGWVLDDGRPMSRRSADGALHLARAAVGELERWTPFIPERPGVDPTWTPVQLEQVAIIDPTVEARPTRADDLQHVAARVGRYEVTGLATPRIYVLVRNGGLSRHRGFITLTSARIRHLDYRSLDIRAAVALLNPHQLVFAAHQEARLSESLLVRWGQDELTTRRLVRTRTNREPGQASCCRRWRPHRGDRVVS